MILAEGGRQFNRKDDRALVVWVTHPVQQTIHAYPADGTVALFRRTDTLTADPVLPDFRAPAADLFRLPGGAS